MAHLVAIDGPLTGLILPLLPPEQTLGRDASQANLVVNDDSVSRRHCRLIAVGAGWELEDLGGRNASYVNGAKISRAALSDGDEIMLGANLFRFVDSRGELVTTARGGATVTIRVDGTALLTERATTGERAHRLDLLLELGQAVAGCRRTDDLLEVCRRWAEGALVADAVIYRQHGARLRLISGALPGSGGQATTLAVDTFALDEVVSEGRTVWMRDLRAIACALGGPDRRHVLLARLRDGQPEADEAALRFAACAARIAGGLVDTLEEVASLRHAVGRARAEIDRDVEVVADAESMRPVVRFVERAAARDSAVLLRGESGTGKQLVAHAIHAASPRAPAPLISVPCAALPGSIQEHELFDPAQGAVARARGGTLYLDEVSDLSKEAQARLCAVLESPDANVRVIAATQREPQAMVSAGELREDLYYRLAVLMIEIPALRDRRSDIPRLADSLLERIRRAEPGRQLELSESVVHALSGWSWPGNVRELRNAIEHGVAMSEGERIELTDLPPYLRRSEPARSQPTEGTIVLPATLREVERIAVQAAMTAAAGNKSKAARILGINRQTLYDKLAAHGITSW